MTQYQPLCTLICKSRGCQHVLGHLSLVVGQQVAFVLRNHGGDPRRDAWAVRVPLDVPASRLRELPGYSCRDHCDERHESDEWGGCTSVIMLTLRTGDVVDRIRQLRRNIHVRPVVASWHPEGVREYLIGGGMEVTAPKDPNAGPLSRLATAARESIARSTPQHGPRPQ